MKINPYEGAALQVLIYKEQAKGLARNDELYLHEAKLLLAAIHELMREVVPEREHEGTDKFLPEKLADEMYDILVFFYSHFKREILQGKIDFNTVWSANGVGKRSDIYDRLEQQLYNLIDDNRPEAVHHFLRLYFSAAKYSPTPLHLLDIFIKTMNKVVNNRPATLYTTYSEILERELTDDEIVRLNQHLERMTRYLRKFLKRDLQPTDWSKESAPEIYWLMLNWMDSDAAFEMLQKLLNSREKVKSGSLDHTVIHAPTTQEIILYSKR